MHIRFANTTDAEAMLGIYSPFIFDSAASFETEVPTIQQFSSRITATTQQYPWLVADVNGQVAGYAYASKHRERAAYQWCVETSVYVHPAFYRQHIGTQLYTALFGLLKVQGLVNAYAGITLPNSASEKLHKSLGFEEVGVYKNIGFKVGRWHDVLWLAKVINDHTDQQPLPKSIDSIMHLLPRSSASI